MSIDLLKQYLPENTLPYLKKWFGNHAIHIHITKNRESKLGDYRKKVDGSHMITVNSTLEPELFLFVLTHELAHLIAFQEYGFRIAPHGSEWKKTFGDMLRDSIQLYSHTLQKILFQFAKNPKANFMASTDLVRYFYSDKNNDTQVFIENIDEGDLFSYQNQKYKYIEKRKKNYLCTNLSTGKKYIFKPIVQVEKLS